MAKAKTARLSLTVPPPDDVRIEAGQDPDDAVSTTRNGPDLQPQDPASAGNGVNGRTGPSDENGVADLDDSMRDNVPAMSPAHPPVSPHPHANSSSPNGDSSRHERTASKTFLSSFKGSKGGKHLSGRPLAPEKHSNEDVSQLALRNRQGQESAENIEATEVDDGTGQGQRRPPTLLASGLSAHGPTSPTSDVPEGRKNGRLFQSFMKRNHSGRGDDGNSSKPSTPTLAKEQEGPFRKPPSRDRSSGRHGSPHRDDDRSSSKQSLKDQRSQSFRDGGGSGSLMSGLRNTTAKAAEGLGKVNTRFLKKSSKQPSNSTLRSADLSHFTEPKVINLPLREQTRITRIARRLEDSRDKTEFWMPALPWRCIDFLNYTGCETEGLYRVPGSDREVRMWKHRFDTEYDVNLFEEEELYDVNTIGSLFKAWLRELPEEVLPQRLQEALSAQHGSEEKAPQALRDSLSNLPPWNYYLLFAITCHLSLLNAYSEKNKMSYHNLFVCFAPALKMNPDCFRWLVADWRNCWKGCMTEKAALDAEYRLLEGEYSTYTEGAPEEGQDEATANSATAADNAFSKTAQPPAQSYLRNEVTPEEGSAGEAVTSGGIPREANESPSRNVLGPSGPPVEQFATQPDKSQLPELSFAPPISPLFSEHPT